MTDPATLLALADRCEQAAWPSNGLDAEIALAIGYTHERRKTERARWWRTPDGQQLAYVGYKNHPPFFTGSLDKAVTLYPVLPEVIPSCPRKASAAALRARAAAYE
jgi:hypothetical protein